MPDKNGRLDFDALKARLAPIAAQAAEPVLSLGFDKQRDPYVGALAQGVQDVPQIARALPGAIGRGASSFYENLQKSGRGEGLLPEALTFGSSLAQRANPLNVASALAETVYGGDTPREAVRKTGRFGTQLAASIPTLGVGAGLAGSGFDYLEGLAASLSGQEPLSEPIGLGQAIQSGLRGLPAEAAFAGAATLGGGLANKLRDFGVGKGIVSKKMELAGRASSPTAIAQQLGIPRGTTYSQGAFSEQLKNVARPIQKYGIAKNIQVDDFSPGAETVRGQVFSQRLDDTLKKISNTRDDLLSTTDSLAQKAGVPKISIKDADLEGLNKLIADRDLSAATALDSDTLKAIREGVVGDFAPDSKILDLSGETFLKLDKPLTAVEASRYLRNVYDKLKEARQFDTAFQAKNITDPSFAQKNAATIDGLMKVSRTLKGKIANYTDDVARKRGERTGRLRELLDDYSNLRPLKDGLQAFDWMVSSGGATVSPASLNATIGGVATGPQAGVRAGITLNPFAEKAATQQILKMPGNMVRNVDQLAGLQTGATPTPRFSDFGKLGRTPAPALLADALSQVNPAAAQAQAVRQVNPAELRNAIGEFLGDRAGQLRPLKKKLNMKSPISDNLINAVIQAESGGDPAAQSRAGAKGLMQLMDATGREVHAELGLESPYDPFNPEQNKLLGTTYLNKMLKRFGDTKLALAAYNWGPGNLGRLLKRARANSFSEIEHRLPKETQNYVRTIFADLRA